MGGAYDREYIIMGRREWWGSRYDLGLRLFCKVLCQAPMMLGKAEVDCFGSFRLDAQNSLVQDKKKAQKRTFSMVNQIDIGDKFTE